MRRLCGVFAAALAFTTMAAPAGAQEVVAPEEATTGLCVAHVAIVAPLEQPHEAVPLPAGGLEACPAP